MNPQGHSLGRSPNSQATRHHIGFHGTDREFEKFNPLRGWKELIYFTTSLYKAIGYAQVRSQDPASARVIQVKLRPQRTLTIRRDGACSKQGNPDRNARPLMAEEAKREGYDMVAVGDDLIVLDDSIIEIVESRYITGVVGGY